MKQKSITKKEPLFIKSLKLAKSNPYKTALMILFDGLFLVSFFVLYSVGSYLAQIIANTSSKSIFIFISITLVYYLMTLFVYSFFKYCVLNSIKSLFGKEEFSFKRLGQFYSLNIIIAGIFFALMSLFNVLLASIKQDYAPYVFIFLAIPYSLFLYIIINTSHSLFYEGTSIKNAVKEIFRITFTKIKSYKETILVMIFFIALLWLLFLGTGYLISLIASKNYNLYLIAYAYFKQASIIIFDIVFYLVILINRISFYAVVREDSQK